MHSKPHYFTGWLNAYAPTSAAMSSVVPFLMQPFQPFHPHKLPQALQVLSINVCGGSLCRTEVGHCDVIELGSLDWTRGWILSQNALGKKYKNRETPHLNVTELILSLKYCLTMEQDYFPSACKCHLFWRAILSLFELSMKRWTTWQSSNQKPNWYWHWFIFQAIWTACFQNCGNNWRKPTWGIHIPHKRFKHLPSWLSLLELENCVFMEESKPLRNLDSDLKRSDGFLSTPPIWSWTLGSHWKNETADKSSADTLVSLHINESQTCVSHDLGGTRYRAAVPSLNWPGSS